MSRNTNPAISVVIPIYNGETYLRETLDSLSQQSFKDFEVICVNDGSTDGSFAILEELALRDTRIKVISKPNGGDATKAIIYGLSFATGRYFMYSSQDDLFSKDLLEKGFLLGEENNADAVVPDVEFYFKEDSSKRQLQSIRGVNGDRSRVLEGREAFVLSLDWTIHGFVLWKMDVVRNVGFATYGLSSDEYTTRLFFFHSKKVVFSDGIFYYRQDNPGAITKKWNINQLDYIETFRRLNVFAVQNKMQPDEVAITNRLMLDHFIRVQVMFSNNVKKMTEEEVMRFHENIKILYSQNIGGIRSMRTNTIEQKIKKICCSNFIAFQVFSKFLQIRQKWNV